MFAPKVLDQRRNGRERKVAAGKRLPLRPRTGRAPPREMGTQLLKRVLGQPPVSRDLSSEHRQKRGPSFSSSSKT